MERIMKLLRITIALLLSINFSLHASTSESAKDSIPERMEKKVVQIIRVTNSNRIDFMGQWKILNGVKLEKKKLKLRKVDLVLEVLSGEGKGVIKMSDACRGLFFGANFHIHGTGKIILEGDQEQIIRTTQILPCDSKFIKQRKELSNWLSDLQEGVEIHYALSRNLKKFQLSWNGKTIYLKKKK